MQKKLAIAAMISSGVMLLVCLANRPKESGHYMMITAAVLFSGRQISLAICSSRENSTDGSCGDRS